MLEKPIEIAKVNYTLLREFTITFAFAFALAFALVFALAFAFAFPLAFALAAESGSLLAPGLHNCKLFLNASSPALAAESGCPSERILYLRNSI